MKYRALVSFSGALSMHQGEVRELNNKVIIKDLLRAKHIEEVTEKSNIEKELQNKIEKLENKIQKLEKMSEAAAGEVNGESEPAKDVKPNEGK
jgi:Skp family chaperone for outer membrane proteins